MLQKKLKTIQWFVVQKLFYSLKDSLVKPTFVDIYQSINKLINWSLLFTEEREPNKHVLLFTRKYSQLFIFNSPNCVFGCIRAVVFQRMFGRSCLQSALWTIRVFVWKRIRVGTSTQHAHNWLVVIYPKLRGKNDSQNTWKHTYISVYYRHFRILQNFRNTRPFCNWVNRSIQSGKNYLILQNFVGNITSKLSVCD